MKIVSALRRWAKALKKHVLVVYCIGRDPRTPLPVKALAVFIAAYALSPVDLIPDFIPVLGLLDDLLIVPLGVMLVMRWVPEPVLRDARDVATAMADRPVSRVTAVAIIVCWALAAIALAAWAMHAWRA